MKIKIYGIAALLICCLSISAALAEPGNKMKCPDATSRQADCPFLTCVDNCARCHRQCILALNYCIKKGGKYADPEHIQTLLDCAQMCQTSTDFMTRQSKFHDKVCQVCSEICAKCADSCAALNDDKLADCVEMCRKCSESCKKMAEDNHNH
jgi:hypothetical protein